MGGASSETLCNEQVFLYGKHKWLPIYDVYLKRASDFFRIGKVGSGF